MAMNSKKIEQYQIAAGLLLGGLAVLLLQRGFAALGEFLIAVPKQKESDRLDAALADTFPASDPVQR